MDAITSVVARADSTAERIVVARTSPPRIAGLLVVDVVLLGVSVVCLFLGPAAAVVGAVGIAFWGVGLLVLAPRLFSTEPMFVLDREGIRNCRVSSEPVRWSEIAEARVVTAQGTRLLGLWLAEPEQYWNRLGRRARYASRISAGLGCGHIAITAAGTQRSLEEICEYAQQRLAESREQ
jgi:hypothetical protein